VFFGQAQNFQAPVYFIMIKICCHKAARPPILPKKKENSNTMCEVFYLFFIEYFITVSHRLVGFVDLCSTVKCVQTEAGI